MTLAGVYGFWKYVSKLERREARRYLEMFYIVQFRELVSSKFELHLMKRHVGWTPVSSRKIILALMLHFLLQMTGEICPSCS